MTVLNITAVWSRSCVETRGAARRGAAGIRLLLHSSTGALNPGAAGSPCVTQAVSVRHPASALMSRQITFLLKVIGHGRKVSSQ